MSKEIPFKLSGTRVTVKENENVNFALKRFKKKVDDSGVLETLRRKEFYEKPTSLRKRKAAAARSRWMKKLRESELPKKMY
jgi:small subunit ribosomal protein S21